MCVQKVDTGDMLSIPLHLVETLVDTNVAELDSLPRGFDARWVKRISSMGGEVCHRTVKGERAMS